MNIIGAAWLVANKRHFCTWCSERIEKGERYYRYACVDSGDIGTVKMHHECEAASRRWAEQDPYNNEYDPGTFTRGCTCERGDPGHGSYKECLLPSKPASSSSETPLSPPSDGPRETSSG